MGASRRDQDLIVPLADQIERDPFPEGGAVPPQVDDHIPHMAVNASDQLWLLHHPLEMEGADHTLVACGVEDLRQIVLDPVRLEDLLGVVLREAASVVICVERRDLDEARDTGLLELERLNHVIPP